MAHSLGVRTFDGLTGFPCNQFKSQEPNSHAKILKFTAKRGVTFPIFAKVCYVRALGAENMQADSCRC